MTEAPMNEKNPVAEALTEIWDMTHRRQLPITSQINELARTALKDKTNG